MRKLVGIYIITLLIATMSLPISAMNKEYEIPVKTIAQSVDVPVWEVGDSWRYNAIFYQDSSVPDGMTLLYTIEGELVFSVIDDTGDSYKLEGTGGKFSGDVDLGLFGMKTTSFTSIYAELQFRKADLGLEFWRQNMKGILLLTIGPLTLPIPIQIEANVDVSFNPTWVITPFPLSDGKTGKFDDTELIHTNNKLAMFWGLIPIIAGDDYAWNTGEIPYTCKEEQITVEAGTFNVFNISGDLYYDKYHDYYRTYYSPELGNAVKETIHIDALPRGVTYYYLDLELISTTYEL